jgi:hypothetical protein
MSRDTSHSMADGPVDGNPGAAARPRRRDPLSRMNTAVSGRPLGDVVDTLGGLHISRSIRLAMKSRH